MKKILITGIFSLALLIAFAQDKIVHTYTLKEAVDYAVQNNVSVKKAALDQEKAKAFNWEILTQGLPQVSASIEYDYYFKVPQVPAFTKIFNDPNGFSNIVMNDLASTYPDIAQLLKNGGSFSNISFVLPNTVNSGLTVTQLLFDARYMFGIKARKDLYKVSRLSKEATEQEIRYSVTKAYYQALAAQEAKGLLQQNMTLVDKLLDETQKTFEQGLIEDLDVSRLQLGKSTLEGQINMQNQLSQVALANLKFQMGLPLNDDIVLTDKLSDLKTALTPSENKFDPSQRVEYNLLNTAITLKGYDVKQKRSGYFPSLAGFLNYGWNAQTDKFKEIFQSYTDQTGAKKNYWYPQGLVGLKLNIPIFDSGLKMAQVKQAKLEQQKAQYDFDNFKQAAQLQFESAQSTFNTAVNDETISQKTADLSEKIYTRNQAKFKAGVGSSFELVQAEQEFTTNQLKHIQSVMNLLNAKADLDKAMGIK